jgi:hypothetical protein
MPLGVAVALDAGVPLSGAAALGVAIIPAVAAVAAVAAAVAAYAVSPAGGAVAAFTASGLACTTLGCGPIDGDANSAIGFGAAAFGAMPPGG